MYDQERDLIAALAGHRIGRRDFMRRASQLGLGAAAMSGLMGQMASSALAADSSFDWKAHKGTTLKLLLNKHPYADAMIADLDAFKELTGMDVTYDVFPEDVYFDKVTAALSSSSSEYDALMTGAYQTWTYGPAGWLVDLNDYIQDSAKTAGTWDWDDVLPNLRASTSWSGVPGEALGGKGAKQWALPWAFELNSISYNKRIFDQQKLEVPKNLPDLMETAAKITKDVSGVYGIGVRGSRSWATIHPGFLSGYVNYGAKDFTVDGGSLKAAMNSPEAKTFTADWVKMIQESGPKNWSTYTWYQVGNDLGAGASGMIFDADILGYFQNNGDTKEKGNIGFHAFAANPDAKEPTPNVWIWSLAMSNFSTKKDAAWYFMQWATSKEHDLFGAVKKDMVNPVRQSVWDNDDFKTRIAQNAGYLEQFKASEPGAKIYFTPQPLFFDVTTAWAAMLQRLVAKELPVDEGLDQLVASIDDQMSQAGLQ
ncbi:extracellular solute-binding protein [Jiella sp. MQZ9-1]|uniref:Extracellular solute-binding protein n=1 Tax=Jiella flava TaxID=2816857 RepID=A0A939FYZ1_9HYPH|nr:extracellular solute-binding protein [Jiella flava]MBO0662087.1 extracellular solute-binding protein [Jiella flava]MCD2470585.1 extracellular solute-binding protein [Jiella flava]